MRSMARKDNPDTTIKNLNDADVPDELRDLGPRRVSEAQLARWLTEQLQTCPGCGAITVDRLFRLDAPDSEGCNWSRTLVLDPRGVSPDVYVVPYALVVDKARKLFALE
jgi:hypothetical protein